jgi:hypothetical protein
VHVSRVYKFTTSETQIVQAAWEARCDIKPVMSDEEIAICKEVRSRPAP